MKYLIIGAGPAGLGSDWFLANKNISDWIILEKNNFAGGLSASFRDKQGFYWDFGGHVIFAKDSELAEIAKKNNLPRYKRKAAIFLKDQYIPYPFQDNFPIESASWRIKPSNFRDWLLATFGHRAAELFFIPQNEKSWAYDLKKLSFSWIEKRIKLPKDKTKNWGGNASFYYPKKGGIGCLWEKIAQRFKNKIFFNKKVVKINFKKKFVFTADGKNYHYQYLISTMPLSCLVPEKKLKHNQGFIIGLGIEGRLKVNFHWVYYPEKKYSFFRAVFPSNFSQLKKNFCSVMTETTLGPKPKVNEIIKQIKSLGLFDGKIISVFTKEVDYFYPIPTLDRDKVLEKINVFLNKNNIYSIGRFGGWKYETGNMDDAFSAISAFTAALNT